MRTATYPNETGPTRSPVSWQHIWGKDLSKGGPASAQTSVTIAARSSAQACGAHPNISNVINGPMDHDLMLLSRTQYFPMNPILCYHYFLKAATEQYGKLVGAAPSNVFLKNPPPEGPDGSTKLPESCSGFEKTPANTPERKTRKVANSIIHKYWFTWLIMATSTHIGYHRMQLKILHLKRTQTWLQWYSSRICFQPIVLSHSQV